MAKNQKSIEVRSADGHLLFVLRVSDEAQTSSNSNAGARAPASRNGRPPANNQRSSAQENAGGTSDDPMTDAQKRYLFRILADQGTEGEQALTYLKERFGVDVLTNVSKREASGLIEELLGTAA